MLIVVAITAVLIAIAIPVFTAQLHRSQDATDQSNLRSYYAELQADFLLNGKPSGWSDVNTDTKTFTFKNTGETITLKNLSYQVKCNDKTGYYITWKCDGHGDISGTSSGSFGGTGSGTV